MCDLTSTDRVVLRGMIRLRLALHRDLEESIETLAVDAGPETGVLPAACDTVTKMREQRADLELLLHKLDVPTPF